MDGEEKSGHYTFSKKIYPYIYTCLVLYSEEVGGGGGGSGC